MKLKRNIEKMLKLTKQLKIKKPMTELENVAKYKDCFNIIRDEIEKKN